MPNIIYLLQVMYLLSSIIHLLTGALFNLGYTHACTTTQGLTESSTYDNLLEFRVYYTNNWDHDSPPLRTMTITNPQIKATTLTTRICVKDSSVVSGTNKVTVDNLFKTLIACERGHSFTVSHILVKVVNTSWYIMKFWRPPNRDLVLEGGYTRTPEEKSKQEQEQVRETMDLSK